MSTPSTLSTVLKTLVAVAFVFLSCYSAYSYIMRTELVEPIKVHTPLVEYGAGINVEKGLYLHAKPDVDLVMKAIEPAKEKLKYLKAASDNVKLKLREAKDYVHEYLIDNDNNNEK